MAVYQKNPSGFPEESNHSTNNFTLNEALMAVDKGYSVIPLNPRGKTPKVPWLEYQSIRATKEEVRDWHKQWPDMNYGIVTGEISGITVLDVDAKYGGLESLEQLRDRLPEVPIVSTGGGGYHLYFTSSGEVNAENSATTGLDIRGNGGYVVGAGSTHANGTVYGWELNGVSPQPMPTWLPELAKGKPKPEPVIKSGTTGTVIPEGKRNNSLTKQAGELHRKGLNTDVIEAVLIHINATQCVPSLPNSEVHTIVDSVTSYEREKPKHTYKAEAFSDWGSEVIPEPEYIINVPAIARGHLVMFAAPPKSGKSTLARHMAVAKANGETFLGEDVTQGNVLYIAAEENPNDVKRAFQKLAKGMHSGLWVHFGNVGDYDDAMTGIREDIREKDISLVIVDTAFKLRNKSFDTNEYNAGYDWATPFMDLAHDENVSVVMLHHVNKKGWHSEGYDALRGVLGSSALSAAVDSVISLRRDDKDMRYLFAHGRLEDMPPIILNFDKETNQLTHGGTKAEYEVDIVMDEIMEFMSDRNGATGAEVREEIPRKTQHVTTALKQHVELGNLFKRKDGRKDYYSAFPFSEPKGEKQEKLEQQGEYDGM